MTEKQESLSTFYYTFGTADSFPFQKGWVAVEAPDRKNADLLNYYIDAQITNMINIAQTFDASCKMAATKNDGTIDRSEAKQLMRIHASTERFIKELKSIQSN